MNKCSRGRSCPIIVHCRYRSGGVGGNGGVGGGLCGKGPGRHPPPRFSASSSDGAGRTGTYILVDMVLNRMAKGTARCGYRWEGGGGLSPHFPRAPALGVKEIDIAATLEHIRDQRPGMVQTKVPPAPPCRLALLPPPRAGAAQPHPAPLPQDQFEFALTAVAEEVNAILKALPQ